MIESAAYDIIKQDGIQEGMQKGIQEGMRRGIQEGMVIEAREMLLEVIQARFGAVPDDIADMLARISDRNALKSMHKQAIICEDIHTLRKKLATAAP